MEPKLTPDTIETVLDPSLVVVHGNATVHSRDERLWPTVTTPEVPWAYTLEFPLPASDRPGTGAGISVELTISTGAVGIGCLGHEGNMLCEAFRAAEDGRDTVLLSLRSLAACKSVMIRNDGSGRKSVVQIHDVRVVSEEAMAAHTLEVPAETFAPYQPWSGLVPGGFVVDWLGTKTHGDVEAFSLSDAIAPLIAHDRQTAPPLPTTELMLDWVPLLEAVELAGERCTAVALGAGWGRWIVGTAFAAMRRNKDYFIVGVEAEPQHFAWMQRHLGDNSIDPRKARLIRAAANSYTGECAFMVGDATNNYGQSIVSETQLQSEAFMAMLKRNGLEVERVPCVDLLEVTRGIERVDYMHMDIQGTEAEFLLAHPERLDECVALVNIGTHTELIERQLRRHFTSRGWLRRYDIPMNATIVARYQGKEPVEITLGDGVQVWENPRLTGRKTAPSFVARCIVRG